MNRRNFLKLNGALAVGALLPKAALSQSSQCTPSTYYGNISADGKGEYWSLYVKVCEKTIFKFNEASKADKIFEIKPTYYEHGVSKGNSVKGLYKFEITSVSVNEQTQTASCKAKIDEYNKSGYQFPKSMFNRKRITFTVKKVGSKRIIAISSKKGELATVSRTIAGSSSSGSSGCYLTTAVTQHRQLPDHCHELQLLRKLRDDFMLQDKNGKNQVKAYYEKAPALVARINSFDNSDEIYEHMFKHMIRPAVRLVEAGHYNEAVTLYGTFSEALYKAYM